MVVSQRYDVIDMERGLLDRSIFTDEQIYQEELEQIFGRAWLYIGHESLIPNPNDFFLTYMGEDPVILTRDAKGQVHAFLNMCRHRGNRVVRADDGNAKNFMCTYHGWTFSNEGKLVSVPGLQEAYYGELDVEHLGLVEAHLDTYAGIVFATWAEDAPSLEAYLGDKRWFMDTHLNHRDCGIQLVGPVKWVLPANWKTPVDNSTDLAHGLITHRSSAIVQSRFKGTSTWKAYLDPHLRFLSPSRHVVVGNGHGVVGTIRDEDPTTGAREGQQTRSWDREREMMEAHAKSIQGEVERRLGTHRARRVSEGVGSVFPNMWLGLMMAHPRGPHNTEMWAFAHFDKDAPEQTRRAIVRNFPQTSASHPTSIHAQDDMNNWQQVTDSGRYNAVPHLPQDLSMGVRHDRIDPKYPGIRTSEAHGSETGQRNFYARWQEFMNAGSWADIHIDPITAKFEGTATMKG